MNQFNENLKNLRSRRGLSQYDMAEKLNIKRARYNTWEMGTAEPSIHYLIELCTFFNVDLNELIGVKEINKPPLEHGHIWYLNNLLEQARINGLLQGIDKTVNGAKMLELNSDCKRILDLIQGGNDK